MSLSAPARWMIMSVRANGQRAVCRFLIEKPNRDLPLLVQIAWSYTEADENGFPPPALRLAMDAFEESLDELVSAHLALVVTGMGMKQWSFYGKNVEAFSREFRTLTRAQAAAPIEITYRLDPKWQYWWDFRKHRTAAESVS